MKWLEPVYESGEFEVVPYMMGEGPCGQYGQLTRFYVLPKDCRDAAACVNAIDAVQRPDPRTWWNRHFGPQFEHEMTSVPEALARARRICREADEHERALQELGGQAGFST